MAVTTDLFVVNKNGMIVDKYYLGGNRTAKLLLNMVSFVDTPGGFPSCRLTSNTIIELMGVIMEKEADSYFGNKVKEVIADLKDTYDDGKFWFNIVVTERK